MADPGEHGDDSEFEAAHPADDHARVGTALAEIEAALDEVAATLARMP